MSDIILITGSEGLIGTALCSLLGAKGIQVRRFDLKHGQYDVLDGESIRAGVKGCTGIIHLAAVSRVIWGEREPERCWRTNVDGTRNVLQAAAASERKPWVILASSREVYGHAPHLPATEDSPLAPCNVYGRSKLAGEQLCREAAADGLRTGIVRLSNVYGSTRDHPDRVVPCFARQSVYGEPLRIDGPGCTFDFTHLDDTVFGILAVVDVFRAGGPALPPIHFLTGQPTTLGELAQLASREAGGHSQILEAASRSFDVARFYGDPRRARELLGWSPRIGIGEGLRRLIRDFTHLSRHATDQNMPQREAGAPLP